MVEKNKTKNGPFGFPMPGDLAHEVESMVRTLPSECRNLIDQAQSNGMGLPRMVVVPKATTFEEGERADISMITTEDVDHMDEVVLSGGVDLSAFQKTGMPVTWAHKYDQAPVGRALWVSPGVRNYVKGLMAKTQYHVKPKDWQGDWFPDAVFHLVQNGMNGKSIGFIPKEFREANEKEIEKRPELKGKYVIPKWVMLEYAIAPIPCNPNAVVQSVAKAKELGINIPSFVLNEAEIYVPGEIKTIEELETEPKGEKHVETPKPDPPEEKRKPIQLSAKDVASSIGSIDVKQIVTDALSRQRGRV